MISPDFTIKDLVSINILLMQIYKYFKDYYIETFPLDISYESYWYLINIIAYSISPSVSKL